VEGAVPRKRVRWGHEALWSLTWSVGVGIGVALGGWLTVAGGSGAPGASTLDLGQDLVVIPLVCAAVTFGIIFTLKCALALAGRDGAARH